MNVRRTPHPFKKTLTICPGFHEPHNLLTGCLTIIQRSIVHAGKLEPFMCVDIRNQRVLRSQLYK